MLFKVRERVWLYSSNHLIIEVLSPRFPWCQFSTVNPGVFQRFTSRLANVLSAPKVYCRFLKVLKVG